VKRIDDKHWIKTLMAEEFLDGAVLSVT